MSTVVPTFVVLGATGHIGSAVARSLLDRGRPIRVVTRSTQKAQQWLAAGAQTVVGDLLEPRTLARTLDLSGPARVFALNPPGAVTGDPDAEETATAEAIARGLTTSNVERVVALSTYGARAGARIGDLGTLHRLEGLLSELSAPVAVLRAGYLFSNWDGAVTAARDGRLPVMLDPDRVLPVVSPDDVADAAIRLLELEQASTATHYIEGPQRLTPRQVADQFGIALHRPVQVERTVREDWPAAFEAAGFSAAAVETFVGLNRVVDEEIWATEPAPTRGSRHLSDHLQRLLAPDRQ